jgi:hypothetical protein
MPLVLTILSHLIEMLTSGSFASARNLGMYCNCIEHQLVSVVTAHEFLHTLVGSNNIIIILCRDVPKEPTLCKILHIICPIGMKAFIKPFC